MSQSYSRALRPAFLIVISLLMLWGCKDKRGEVRKAAANAVVQPVEVIAVERRDVTETLSLVGSVAPNESARMRAEVAGLVRSILFEEGQKVTKSQILFTIDDTELVAQTTQAQEAFKLAEINLQRSVTLLGAQNTTQAAHDRAISEFNTAKAQLKMLSIGWKRLKFGRLSTAWSERERFHRGIT